MTRLASEAGLDPEEARALLAGTRYEREARADEQEAHALGITGVPFFVLAGRYGLLGAQPSQTLLEALNQAWAETEAPEPGIPEGAVCGPDGCA